MCNSIKLARTVVLILTPAYGLTSPHCQVSQCGWEPHYNEETKTKKKETKKQKPWVSSFLPWVSFFLTLTSTVTQEPYVPPKG